MTDQKAIRFLIPPPSFLSVTNNVFSTDRKRDKTGTQIIRSAGSINTDINYPEEKVFS
jgi:hypothetical protein